MPTMIGSKEIGGGLVGRPFRVDGELLPVNTRLTPELIKAWPNRRALINSGQIAVFPPDNKPSGARHVVHNGGGRFDVIVGHKLNESPLTREQAEELAAGGGN